MKIKTVCLIEDEKVMHDLFKDYLEAAIPHLEIVAMIADAADGIESCIDKKPDLVVLDIRMPGINGLEILHLLKMKIPKSKILIYSGTISQESIDLAIKGNVDGFVSKGDGMECVKKGIETLEQGKKYFSPGISKHIMTGSVG